MRILLCGARGFLGRHIQVALQTQGHTVIGAGSVRHAHCPVVVDYAQDTSVAAWLPRLEDIDAVVNAVGVLRDSPRRPIEAVHRHTPIALFEACSVAGQARRQTLRVIQISALGVEGNPTRYASSKRAADQHLLGLHAAKKVSATVLRPSIVFGQGGQSSQLFVQLSKLPLLLLPQAVLRARVQPVAVQDLARAVALLLEPPRTQALLECVGTQALTVSAFIASLRQQQNKHAARVLPLPAWLSRLSVGIGDRMPAIPWCSETEALLAKDNVSASPAFAHLLGHAPLPVEQFWSQAWQR